MEFWASPEPTFARLGADVWRDQLAETGHDRRPQDIALIAGLGVDACRYPVLWERNDLEWARPRLEALHSAGVEPIVTLLHHGSGPAFTNLLDPAFPELFADYAESVARAFPWIRRWTPINEPLTTARFSTLYGHWYPNLRDDRAFGRALVYQALAIQTAFERIKRTIPNAELVVTEDLQGFTAGTAAAESYVAFLSERRWLSFELVLGRVDRDHSLWRYLSREADVPVALLREVGTRAVHVDLAGWNWYPYSERFILSSAGVVHDLGAVEIPGSTISPRPLLREAHARLGLPQALAEVHLNAPEVARARWLLQRYDDAAALREEGIPIRAIGAWAAFGMIDWDSLLRERRGSVEDGIFTFEPFDRTPRETAVSRTLRELARRCATTV